MGGCVIDSANIVTWSAREGGWLLTSDLESCWRRAAALLPFAAGISRAACFCYPTPVLCHAVQPVPAEPRAVVQSVGTYSGPRAGTLTGRGAHLAGLILGACLVFLLVRVVFLCRRCCFAILLK